MNLKESVMERQRERGEILLYKFLYVLRNNETSENTDK